ncbi:putative adhesin [Ectopseudomonas hydrolytica]|uniref:putative adhesin n=1 Tax=Ectopseudomonas hydrolytica TaxID=2493633 RepID=UPI0020B88DA0|nr:hypothetical protein [Pseudomonas hydrolytica]UTH29638.1 hypothetical protein NLY38_14350 [Pseudomonas hydrolytica]
MYFIFWGHGDWGPEDGHTFIPQGSQLYFFARHKEEINTERMDSILYAVKEGIDRGVKNIIKNEYFDLHEERSLRRIKPGGARIRNYRLLPPSGDVYAPEPLDSKIAAVCKIITTAKPEGERLEELFKQYGAGPATYLWVPCRAVRGVEDNLFVDGFNYEREADYFKGS